MTFHERVQAVAKKGFTERQVRVPAHAEHEFRLKLNADSGGS